MPRQRFSLHVRPTRILGISMETVIYTRGSVSPSRRIATATIFTGSPTLSRYSLCSSDVPASVPEHRCKRFGRIMASVRVPNRSARSFWQPLPKGGCSDGGGASNIQKHKAKLRMKGSAEFAQSQLVPSTSPVASLTPPTFANTLSCAMQLYPYLLFTILDLHDTVHDNGNHQHR